MTPTLRRLLAIGFALSLLAALAVGFTRRLNPEPSHETSGAASLASLAVGAVGLLAHRRRRVR